MQARRWSARATFAGFLGSLSSHFVRIGPPAEEADLDALQASAPARFSEQLIALHRKHMDRDRSVFQPLAFLQVDS